MENTYLNKAADGAAEDMIRSFVQIGCAEVHEKTLYEKALGELEGLEEKDYNKANDILAKMDDIAEEIDRLASLRRKIMLRLYEMYHGDKNLWCQVKHLGIGAYTLFEAYQASDRDQELLDLAMEANKAFLRALSGFLGIEITECAACFADLIKAAGKE